MSGVASPAACTVARKNDAVGSMMARPFVVLYERPNTPGCHAEGRHRLLWQARAAIPTEHIAQVVGPNRGIHLKFAAGQSIGSHIAVKRQS